MMDEFTRRYFGLEFGIRFSNVHGNEFQSFFGTIMNMRYPSDFTQTRPWGELGDYKCDGYLKSKRKYYQCYAPEEMSKSVTTKKINEDFNGAIKYKKYFDYWVFVHNSRNGCLPTWCVQELQDVQLKSAPIIIEPFGFIELREEVLKLDETQLVDLFGRYVTLSDVLAVNFEDLKPLINYIAQKGITDDFPPKPVSKQKLAFNALDENIEFFLRIGMLKSSLVKLYLDQTPDKELAGRLTTAFKAEYLRLKQMGFTPDGIFYGLQVFAQGVFSQPPRTQAAVLAILSYLFEACDIFENPLG